MNTGDRIKLLCEEYRTTLKSLSEAIYVSPVSMTRWVKGDRKINVDALVRISKYFDVSTDWLLGLSDIRNTAGFIDGDELMEYCKKAVRTCESLRQKVLREDLEEKSATTIANTFVSAAYFEREICRWRYDIPGMIHDVASSKFKKERSDGKEDK